MAAVVIRAVHKHFGSTHVIRGVDIEIADGEFCVLVGPSGCGKSTLLRMIAGLEEIGGGEIAIGGTVVNRVPPKERDIAMVFQNYALYPHMTVRDNMSFALMLAKRTKADIARARAEGGRHPRPRAVSRPLSAAALGRTAAARRDGPGDRPRPAGLPVRRAAVEPRCEAARADAHRDQGAPPAPEDDVDLRDARPDRGDDDGRQDRRDARRRRRADRRPARSLRPSGQYVRRRIHRLAGDEHDSRRRARGRRRLARSNSPTASRCPRRWAPRATDGQPVLYGLRPEHCALGSGGLPVDVIVVEPTGADTQLYCRFNGQEVTATIDDRTNCRAGDRINLAPDLRRAHLFDAASGARLAA